MIGTWDPTLPQGTTTPDFELLKVLALHATNVQTLDEESQQRAIEYIRLPESSWASVFPAFSDNELIDLAFFYVRAEMLLAGFDAKAANPAIWIFRFLKAQKRLPDKHVIRTLKAETDNRYIPYGNVLL